MKPWPLHPPTGILATQSPGASGWSPQSHGFLAYHVETKTELVSRHHSAHSDTLVPPSHPSLHTGHSSAHVKQAFVRIRFKKYQCIVQELSPNIMHHTTHHSFALFFVFCFNFFFNKSSCLRFFIRDFVPSIFLLFISTTSQSAFIPGLTEAQDMVQNGMLWLEHTPLISLQGQVNQEAGQDTTYPQREAKARSKVPLHVQGQVV